MNKPKLYIMVGLSASGKSTIAQKLAEENPVPDWVMMNGNRIQIKRKQFEKMIDTVDAI